MKSACASFTARVGLPHNPVRSAEGDYIMATIYTESGSIEVTESINVVRSSLNKLTDPENRTPFHGGSFTRASDGHRVIVALTPGGLKVVAEGERKSRSNGGDDDES